MVFKPWRSALGAFPSSYVVAALALAIIPLGVMVAGQPTVEAAPAATSAQTTLAATTRQEVTHLWESVKVRTGDTLGRILTSRGHKPATVQDIIESGPAAKALTNIKAGATLKVATDAQGDLSALTYAPDPYRVVNVRRNENGVFESEVIEKQSVTATRFAEGTVEDSLFAAGKKVGVSDTVILEMADAFGYDIDFALEVQTGDKFRVLYEDILVDGEHVRDGQVLAAEFINQGKTYRAVRYTTADGHAGYYTPDGLAMHRAFLRTPVDFARISSTFSKARFHPVLHTMRAHKGVDYAAARGTPVKATADGRVEYAGNKGGYGRVIVLQHANRQETLYAHLEGFAKSVHAGAHVSQGQVIGYVGMTGLATGPHLHYEFHVNGVYVDPLKVKTSQAQPIAVAEKQAFLMQANRLVATLDSFSGKAAVVQAGTPVQPGGTARL